MNLILEWDWLLSQSLVPPHDLIIFFQLMFCELDGEFCYHEAFETQKRVFTRLEDNTDNMQRQTEAAW